MTRVLGKDSDPEDVAMGLVDDIIPECWWTFTLSGKSLCNLAVNTENEVKIGAEGGVEAIVQVMGGHCRSQGVQREGCGSMLNLNNNTENKVKIRAEGWVEAIVQAMGGH